VEEVSRNYGIGYVVSGVILMKQIFPDHSKHIFYVLRGFVGKKVFHLDVEFGDEYSIHWTVAEHVFRSHSFI